MQLQSTELQILMAATKKLRDRPTLHLIAGGGTTPQGINIRLLWTIWIGILVSSTALRLLALLLPRMCLSSQSIHGDVDFIVSRSMSCTEFPCLTVARMIVRSPLEIHGEQFTQYLPKPLRLAICYLVTFLEIFICPADKLHVQPGKWRTTWILCV